MASQLADGLQGPLLGGRILLEVRTHRDRGSGTWQQASARLQKGWFRGQVSGSSIHSGHAYQTAASHMHGGAEQAGQGQLHDCLVAPSTGQERGPE